MVVLKESYKIAYDFFVSNGYDGISECRDFGDSYVFFGKLENVVYGTSEVVIPKNGAAPYLIDISHEPEASKYRKAKRVDLNDISRC